MRNLRSEQAGAGYHAQEAMEVLSALARGQDVHCQARETWPRPASYIRVLELLRPRRIIKNGLNLKGQAVRPWDGGIQIKEGLATAPDATLAAAAFFHFEK